MGTYLSQFEPIVYAVFEWAHLDLPNELRLDLRVAEYSREELVQVGRNDVHLVMDGRVQRCQG